VPTVLITGVAGFIGRHVAHEFAQLDWKVVGCDRAEVSKEFRALWGLSTFARLDLIQENLDDLLEQNRPSVLIHAAGPASVPDSLIDPLGDFDSSAVTLFRVLESVRRCLPDCRLIFLSSAAVYGNPQTLPVREDHTLTPISPYGYHKLLCEKIIEEFHTVYGLRTCVARIFSAYGIGLRRQVLWDICQKALNGPIVELFGTGFETRDFVSVDDVAKAVRIISEGAQFEGEAYNIGNGKEVRINDLASLLIAALNRDCEVRFTGVTRRGDPLRWCADVTLLQRLGFRPTVSIERGVADYGSWVLKNINA
jgi:UDP-glucose 4-epimerase